MNTRRVRLIVNSSSGAGDGSLDEGLARLERAGLEVEVCHSSSAEHLNALIEEVRDSVELLLVAGGDGTVHSALGALADSGLTLGVIPKGTANDLARTLGIPLEPLAAFETIATGEARTVDLASANGIYFSNAAHLGLGVQVTRNMSAVSKAKLGVLSYLQALGAALFRRRVFDAAIETETGAHRVSTIQLTVGNGRFYGGGNVVDEAADIADRRLHLFSLAPQRLWRLLLVLPLLRFGKQRHSRRVLRLYAKSIQVTTHKPTSVYTDGEPTTRTPVSFRIHPGALTVMVPKTAPELRATVPGASSPC